MSTRQDSKGAFGEVLVERLLSPWGALLFFVLLAVLGTYPLAFHLDAAYLPPEHYEGSDYGQFVWTFWWVKKALLELHAYPYETDFIFFPVGTSLAFHTVSEYNSFLAAPLGELFSREAAYNILFLSSIALSGWGAYFLGRHITGDSRAAVLAGIIYTYNATHFTKYGHINLAAYQWLPFFFLFYLKSVKDQRWRDYFAAAFFFLLAAASAWAFEVFIVLLVALFLVFTAFSGDRTRIGSYAKSTFWIFLISGMLVAPIAYPMLKELLFDRRFSYIDTTTFGLQDIFGFSLDKGGHRYTFSWFVIFGYTAAALALGAVFFFRDRTVRFWLLALLFFFSVCLGPYWAFHGKAAEGLRLPFWYMSKIPVINGVRLPYRYWTMVMLALSMLGALCYGKLASARTWGWKKATAVFACIAMLAVIENTVMPRPYWKVEVPEFYQKLKAEGGSFGVLEFPFLAGRDGAYMYFQTIHEKKLMTAHIARIPPFSYGFINSNRFTSALRGLASGKASVDLLGQVRPEDIRELSEKGIRYVIVHTAYLSGSAGNYKAEPASDTFMPLAFNSSYRGLFDKTNLELDRAVFRDEAAVNGFFGALKGLLGEPVYDSAGIVAFSTQSYP